ncbi:MAG: nitrous oxide reductase accessory protein NosL [Sulfurospirillaceae bacterium]|nr:nitrous oxide reductase accessory protein NosL [Sulfurospirillaceae bacterium]
MFLGLALSVLLGLGAYAQEFTKVASGEPELIQEGKSKMWCPICGMNLKMFYKTSHAVKLKDGINKQYCSIRCLAVDYPSIEGKIDSILVTDAKSEKLIDAKKAYYVAGSKVPGTMTKVSKIAFSSEADAKNFAAQYGGNIINFDKAFAMAKESLKDDMAMTLQSKQKMMYPMGQKVYEKSCKKEAIHLHNYNRINDLKAGIKTNGTCGTLEEKELQALALYLWEVKRFDEHKHNKKAIQVGEDEKCPVCGMFVAKYPRWAARMSYKAKDKDVSLAFDGVKDMLKFYFNPSKWGTYEKQPLDKLTIMVTDYYTQEAIDGKKAFYVLGSDVYGPMGKEFIPFGTKSSAETFMKDHKAQTILEFLKIDEELVYKQDK